MNHTMILNTMTNVKVLSFGEDLGEVLGNAVYTVRVILNIDPDVVEVKSAFMPKLPKQEVICNAVRVFPNPAKETISVAFDQPISNDGVIEVWSIVGKKLLYNTIFKDIVEQQYGFRYNVVGARDIQKNSLIFLVEDHFGNINHRIEYEEDVILKYLRKKKLNKILK